MFSIWQSCKPLKPVQTEELQFIGFGIRHQRSGVEQIIPNIYNACDHYSLIFNHDAVRVNIDGKITDFPARTLVVWDRSCKALYGAPERQWTLSWLQCRGTAVDRLPAEQGIEINRPVTFGGEQIINRYWIPIFEELSEYRQPDIPLILNLIHGIFLEANRACRPGDGKEAKIPEPFREVRRYIEDHYRQKLTLSELAARLYLAPVYFSRKFKEYFNIAPIDYVIALRLNDAALYLRNPSLSIQEVAELAGYQDNLYFSRLFKRHFGSSPQQYRARLFHPNSNS